MYKVSMISFPPRRIPMLFHIPQHLVQKQEVALNVFIRHNGLSANSTVNASMSCIYAGSPHASIIYYFTLHHITFITTALTYSAERATKFQERGGL